MAAKLAFLKFRTKDESKGLTTFQLSKADCWRVPTGSSFRLSEGLCEQKCSVRACGQSCTQVRSKTCPDTESQFAEYRL